ncbi:O-methyltransferase family 2 protein [Tieghemostelium lacteum]|uniref:O-methyltransferase family 2 protein n=1 Tax=Tieghemostelium lacteum TaxID=361077 RepID=A0A152A3K2_TIELA|nr:O-methyltransferase family 2 protein [Tieghemostelium lacteum]|eukprot:KYR00685.1 O-methyltransferase family 2 protein [Tieghemostelium lacteum]
MANPPTLPSTTPIHNLLQIGMYNTISRIVHAGVYLGLPDHVENGPKSAFQIAKEIKADPDSVYRLMRALSSQGIMREEDEFGVFSKTPTSTLLTNTDKGLMRSGILTLCGDLQYKAHLNLVKTIQTGIPQSDFGYEGGFWEALLRSDPDTILNFNKYMTLSSILFAPTLVKSTSFSGMKIVCDLGGSQGMLIREILKNNPNVQKGINFDLPTIIEYKKSNEDNNTRYEEVAGDFFDSVPFADAYTLKFVLHDWNDDKCKIILKNIENANANAKIIIYDSICDSKNESKFSPIYDIKMKHFLNGRERSPQEWINLAESCNYKIVEFNSSVTPGLIIMVHK